MYGKKITENGRRFTTEYRSPPRTNYLLVMGNVALYNGIAHLSFGNVPPFAHSCIM